MGRHLREAREVAAIGSRGPGLSSLGPGGVVCDPRGKCWSAAGGAWKSHAIIRNSALRHLRTAVVWSAANLSCELFRWLDPTQYCASVTKTLPPRRRKPWTPWPLRLPTCAEFDLAIGLRRLLDKTFEALRGDDLMQVVLWKRANIVVFRDHALDRTAARRQSCGSAPYRGASRGRVAGCRARRFPSSSGASQAA